MDGWTCNLGLVRRVCTNSEDHGSIIYILFKQFKTVAGLGQNIEFGIAKLPSLRLI